MGATAPLPFARTSAAGRTGTPPRTRSPTRIRGIARATARFLDAFLLHCLLHQSPPSDAAARQLARENLLAVVNRGREPGLRLRRPDGSSEELQQAGLRMLDEIAAIGALLDAARSGTEYRDSIALQRAKLERPELTPSARVLEAIRAGGNSFFRFAMAQSERHREHFLGEGLRRQHRNNKHPGFKRFAQ